MYIKISATYLEMRPCNDKVQIARAVNATVIALEDAPQDYQDFDKGAARKIRAEPEWPHCRLSEGANGCALQFCIDGPPLGTPSFVQKIVYGACPVLLAGELSIAPSARSVAFCASVNPLIPGDIESLVGSVTPQCLQTARRSRRSHRVMAPSSPQLASLLPSGLLLSGRQPSPDTPFSPTRTPRSAHPPPAQHAVTTSTDQ